MTPSVNECGGLRRAPSRPPWDSLLGNGCSMRGLRPYNDTEKSKEKPTLSIPGGARILHKGPKVRQYDKLSQMTDSPVRRAYTWLEPDEGKLSCPVLRGGSVSNDALLPDFDRLAERVKAVIGQDPLSNNLFVFRSRRGDRLKILTWDRDGFVLWYKRLESGVFKLPRLDAGTRSMELRASELAMILDGIDMSKLKRVPRYERSARTNTINVQRVSA